jgi:ubiquinone/menaquinone biosynthesis C-methylase UbiE
MKNKSKGISLNYLADYYDYFTFTEKSQFRRNQVDLMDVRQGEKILEVGGGTGALSILSKIKVGEAGEVDGIDIAPKMIRRAQQKARNANLRINFQVASISQIPYPDSYFDLVISSLMFHHLPEGVKKAGLLEIHRVLNKQGRLFLCDFGTPHYLTFPLMYLMLFWSSSTRYQLLGKLPDLFKKCEFNSVQLRKKGLFLEYYLITKNS